MAFRAAYKKQPGKLVFSAQQDYVEWSPDKPAAGTKSVKIPVKDVTSTRPKPRLSALVSLFRYVEKVD